MNAVLRVLRAFVVFVAVEAHAQSAPPAFFTDSQSVRGQQWFEAACLSCHPTRDISSTDFRLRWNGRTALDLYDRISTTMPQPEPGSLSRRAYADIVTYLMRINGLPAGSTVLTTDSTSLALARFTFPLL